jgi:hypothetical protein
LYADLESTPYKTFFNTGTDAKRLWSMVRLARSFDEVVKEEFKDPSATERGIIIHGNRFILHCAFRMLARFRGLELADDFTKPELQLVALGVVHRVRDVMDAFYSGAYPAPLFRNVTKCTDIRAKIEAPPPAT